MRGAAVFLLGLWGCASTQSPFFKDDQYLRFGVDPGQEAGAVIESQKARDFVLSQRQLGRNFTALGFMDKRGRSSAVRILTSRGIAIALDSRPRTPLQAPTTFGLLPGPIEHSYDADKDGFEEVFVEERSEDESCVRVYRVRDVGSVDRVAVETRVWGQDVCPRAVIDLNGDGIVELVTEVELAGFAGLGASVRMPLPLWAEQHRFVARARSAPAKAWLVSERTRRETALKEAKASLDVAQSYLLGIELAALQYLEGAEPAAQLATFDAALSGLVLSPAQASANQRARRRIYTEWNDPSAPAVRVAAQPSATDAASVAATQPAATQPPAASTTAGRSARSGTALQPSAASATPRQPIGMSAPQPSAASAARDTEALKRSLIEASKASKASGSESTGEPARPQHGIQLRPNRRGRPEPLPEPEPAPFWAQPRNPDEPVLADGEFIITPESAAVEEARRRAARKRGRRPQPSTSSPNTALGSSTGPSASTATARMPPAGTSRAASPRTQSPVPATASVSASAQPPSAATDPGSEPRPPTAASTLPADRAAARELGNAAFAARERAAAARQAAADSRREAQAERLRAAQAPDAAAAAEHRKLVAEHIAASERHAAEAAAHAAEAAKHRDALLELKAGQSAQSSQP